MQAICGRFPEPRCDEWLTSRLSDVVTQGRVCPTFDGVGAERAGTELEQSRVIGDHPVGGHAMGGSLREGRRWHERHVWEGGRSKVPCKEHREVLNSRNPLNCETLRVGWVLQTFSTTSRPT